MDTRIWRSMSRASALAYIGFGAILSFFLTSRAMPQLAQPKTQPESHNVWLTRALEQIQSIKPGCTRGQLYTVLADQGGLSTPELKSMIYRESSLIHVDVAFGFTDHPTPDKDGRIIHEESKNDPVLTVSRPYLGWMIID